MGHALSAEVKDLRIAPAQTMNRFCVIKIASSRICGRRQIRQFKDTNFEFQGAVTRVASAAGHAAREICEEHPRVRRGIEVEELGGSGSEVLRIGVPAPQSKAIALVGVVERIRAVSINLPVTMTEGDGLAKVVPRDRHLMSDVLAIPVRAELTAFDELNYAVVTDLFHGIGAENNPHISHVTGGR